MHTKIQHLSILEKSENFKFSDKNLVEKYRCAIFTEFLENLKFQKLLLKYMKERRRKLLLLINMENKNIFTELQDSLFSGDEK